MVRQFINLRGRGVACVVVLAFVIMLLGCDTEKTRNLLDERAGEAQDTLVKAREAQPLAKHYNPLVVTDKVWAGSSAMRMHRGMPLPARFETARGITIISGQPLSLAEIASSITAQTGIPVRIAGTTATSSSSTPGAAPRMPNAGASNVSAVGASNDLRNTDDLLLSYEGPLSGLLERVAGFFSVNWNYDGTSISVVRYETRVFMIEALPEAITTIDSSQTSSISGSSGGSGGGSGGGSSGSSNASTGTLTQNLSYTGNLKYWDELKEILTAMLGGVGNVVITPSNGEVTVTTSPETMHTIADYLVKENKRLSRQIAINIEVYNVDMARDSDFNVSFSAALSRLDNAASIKFEGGTAPTSAGGVTGLSSLSVAVINPDHAPKLQDIFNALSTVGDTTTVAQFPLTTVNNRPVSRFVGTTQYFVPQITGSSTSTVGASSTLGGSSATAVPITSGLTLQLTPRLLDDGRIIMQYSLNIQNITSIQCFNVCTGVSITCNSSSNTGSSNAGSACTLQEPITTNRSFIQQSVLRSGSTLIIGGIDEENAAQNAQGVGDPFNWLLGGGTSNATGRTMVFIALSPQVLDPPRSEQD